MLVAAIGIIAMASWPEKTEKPLPEPEPDPGPETIVIQKTEEELRAEKIKEYLQKKESPLADHAYTLACQKHWKILIAISHIESQFCKRKISYNCWGIGGDSNYRHYAGYDEAIKDANDLIERWQARGRWLTPEDMIGSYVVPGSPNWLRTVKGTMAELEKEIE